MIQHNKIKHSILFYSSLKHSYIQNKTDLTKFLVGHFLCIYRINPYATSINLATKMEEQMNTCSYILQAA